MRASIAALAVLAGLAVVGCSGSATGQRAIVRVVGSLAAGCAHPTATTATYLPTPAGSPGIPRVGPVTFSPSVYQPPEPDKVLVVRVSALPAGSLSLTGYNCDDGRVLRFWYLTSGAVPGLLDKNPGEGYQVAVLPYAPRVYTGYMLFTEPGRWSIVVSDRGKVLGNLVMTVASGCRGGPQYC
jgi:hypothetical protein